MEYDRPEFVTVVPDDPADSERAAFATTYLNWMICRERQRWFDGLSPEMRRLMDRLWPADA